MFVYMNVLTFFNHPVEINGFSRIFCTREYQYVQMRAFKCM